MGVGVLEDRHMTRPPGTSKLGEEQGPSFDAASTGDLKKDGYIILVPQPSDSPNDPLNWSMVQKNSIMLILAFSSGVTTSLGPMISPGLVLISKQYHVSPDMVSTFMVGSILLFTGAVTFFTASGANIWGKRPFFVISTLLLLISNIWGTFADSFPSLAAMRIFQGIASAPLETLVTSTVSDLFFVHQRGLRLSLWGVMLGTGVLLGQIISGYIIEALGISGTFAISALIFCVILPLMYFLIVETTYTKSRTNKMDEKRPSSRASSIGSMDFKGDDPASEPRESYKSQLRIFRGRLSDDSFWKGVGLTNIPLALGTLIFSPISGWMADAVPVWMAKRNGGVFEPEFRLILMLIAIPFSTAGFIGFGFAASKGLPLAWCLVWITMHSVAVPFASQASISYVIDCHTKDANQAFVTINFVKAVMSFVASTVANGMLAKHGPKNLFIGIALLNLGISLLTIPSYVYGKRLRSWVARSEWATKI
ncbi:hypothetical protein Daesc_003745 [Daldinia eschscholtzii]|uniref:Major facilitator superfamily (MFS) profile domain-containing protein n=1 Tax=Daldinia eschscholtzii TaxID=292717 RepID=A0AAX6MMV6_9PEZI